MYETVDDYEGLLYATEEKGHYWKCCICEEPNGTTHFLGRNCNHQSNVGDQLTLTYILLLFIIFRTTSNVSQDMFNDEDAFETSTEIDLDDEPCSTPEPSSKRKRFAKPSEQMQRHSDKMTLLKKLVEPTVEKPSAVSLFFSSVAETVSTFPRKTIAEVKNKIMKVVCDAEIALAEECTSFEDVEYIDDEE